MELQILSSSWMNEETKLSSIEKLAAMKTHIGYPESYKNESYMNHVYDGVRIIFLKKLIKDNNINILS